MGLLGTGGSRSRDEGFSTGPYPEFCFEGLKERLLGTSQSDRVASLSTRSCQFSGSGKALFLNDQASAWDLGPTGWRPAS